MFKSRSQKLELLDGEVPQKDLYQNLNELHTINYLLGGYNISYAGLKGINLEHVDSLVDIGSGGGDTLAQIHSWIKKRHPKFEGRLTGVDLKKECITYSTLKHKKLPIDFIQSDYKIYLEQQNKVDVVHACLFMHHLNNDEIIECIDLCQKSKSILIINDLHRNWLAYYSIHFLTSLFSKSYLVKHDAKLSVQRGFRKKEWQAILRSSKATKYSIQWKWAFRHLVIVWP